MIKPVFTWAWMVARPSRVIACGFGSGLMQPAPGTWGTLMGCLLWFALSYSFPETQLYFGLPLIIMGFWLGVWACEQVNEELSISDHGSLVWDEIIAVWLVLWGGQFLFTNHWNYLLSFLLFRGFDILKPWPIRIADKYIKNGFGVMLDDLIAAIYALLCMIVIYLVLPILA